MLFEPPGTLDPNCIGGINHDFSDRRIGQQGLERSQPNGLVKDALPEQILIQARWRYMRAAQQVAQHGADLSAELMIGKLTNVVSTQVNGFDQTPVKSALPFEK